MTTVSTYEPCLTYEVPFDESTGDKYKLTVESLDPDEAKQTRSMRKFSGNTIEELLYTREVFLNDTGDMEIDKHAVSRMASHAWCTAQNEVEKDLHCKWKSNIPQYSNRIHLSYHD